MIQRYDAHHPDIAPSAFVHPMACIIGEVRIGQHASIWPGTVLRGDEGLLEIGENSNVQDGSVLHNYGGISTTRVGARVTIGHRAIIHGCTIEDDCLIGMGAIVMDNVRIGSQSFVGAGAVLPPNTTVPPRSFVLGVPARIVRETQAREWDVIDHAWRTYVDLARRHADVLG